MSLASEVAAGLASLIGVRARPAALDWFEGALLTVDAAGRPGQFLSVFSAAGRRLGRDTVVPDGAERRRLGGTGFSPFPTGLGLDECGRGALLLRAIEPMPASDRLALVSDLYQRGEVRERQALLRVLAYLEAPALFRDLAVEACRASTQSVFEAIACENPYAAAHFAESSFNHMVLKAVFTGVDLHRIAGLTARVTPELVRMAEDYATERRAAGRTLPDLDLILAAGSRGA